MEPDVHESWRGVIANSLTINLCVLRECHEFLEGFSEHPLYRLGRGGEDCAYQFFLAKMFKAAELLEFQTVRYVRYPQNSYEAQMPRFREPHGEYKGILPFDLQREMFGFNDRLDKLLWEQECYLNRKRERFRRILK